MSEKSEGKVRIGIIGVGGMGGFHADYLMDGKVSRCELTAVCDIDSSRIERFKDIARFTDSAELIRSGKVDAVIVATPHYDHTTIGIDVLENGLHLLSEKPISAHKADAERLLAAHKDKRQIFGVMFQQRTIPVYLKLKQLIDSGELGDLIRVTWIVTDWFRTEAYYSSGGWRATWKGEGGGVLLNQCPHTLDLYQRLFGMPSKLRAFCGFGTRHTIEVEDQVTAYMEYPNGATAVFITSTGEAPGANRLEVAGERGRAMVENGKLTFVRTEVPVDEFLKTDKGGFSTPEVWNAEIPVRCGGGTHDAITQNFVDAILDGVALIAPAQEAINSLELANAMVQSSLTGQTIDMPLDSAAYESTLNGLIEQSQYVKTVIEQKDVDMSASFH